MAGVGQLGIEQPLFLQFLYIDAKLLNQIKRHARLNLAVVFVGSERDVPATYQHFITVQIDPVVTRQYPVGAQQRL